MCMGNFDDPRVIVGEDGSIIHPTEKENPVKELVAQLEDEPEPQQVFMIYKRDPYSTEMLLEKIPKPQHFPNRGRGTGKKSRW